MQSFGSSLMQTTISINDIKLKAHHCNILLAHHYSISTVSLQHHCSIPTASLQQHYSISTASLKQHYSIPAASLQHHYSISSAAPQQHQGKVRMQVSPVKILQLIVIQWKDWILLDWEMLVQWQWQWQWQWQHIIKMLFKSIENTHHCSNATTFYGCKSSL